MDVSNADMDRIRKEMAESLRRMDVSDAEKDRIRKEMNASRVQICSDTFHIKMVESKEVNAVKSVKFCSGCKDGKVCKNCDKTFKSEGQQQTTMLHQMKDVASYVTGKSNHMIADLGAPTSVIGRKDKENFIRNLSKSQRDNLHVISVDENFKFGPSGPFQCKEKLRFQMDVYKKTKWVDVAIVDAEIPMLLGNNIMKPLEAEIKLFAEGDAIIRLGEVEIEMKETKGGHYTVKVQDLGKLCSIIPVSYFNKELYECEKCEKGFENSIDLSEHKQRLHENLTRKSILKNPIKNGEILETNKNCVHNVINDLNTQLNGKLSSKDKCFLQIMKRMAQTQHKESNYKCEMCERATHTRRNNKIHAVCSHGVQLDGECNNCLIESQREKDVQTHELETTIESIFISHHQEENNEDQDELNSALWDILLVDDDASGLSQDEEKEILKLHKYFAHRSGQKLWQNLFQPAGKLKGKKKLILEFLDKCEVCKRYKRTPPRPKVGLPKSGDVNEVVSMDLKIFKKSNKKEIGILYLHDEFSKLIKGQVINDKKKETIVQGIENKWILGGGGGPGHPSKGFFSDNGGEFLNDDLIEFAGALGINIKMTAASSPWMNGSCERAHATVDIMVEKILEDDSKIDLQKAVDLACFVKNTEINKTGFSSLQLFCGRSPAFPGLSDCTPANIHLEGNNEYLKVLRRLDMTRAEARKIDCNQRMKTALKSKINTACEKSYNFGEPVWFKMEKTRKWKSGIVVGQDGKVLFIKYANFIRRVPLDHIIPADEYKDEEEEVDENNQEDAENSNRLDDDKFENMDVVIQKDKEIDILKNSLNDKETVIKNLENKLSETRTSTDSIKKVNLPNKLQTIVFMESKTENMLRGKVINKHKKTSIHRNVVTIQFDDGTIKDFDFSKDVTEWKDHRDISEDTAEPCCLYSISPQEEQTSECFPVVLTKSQYKNRSGVEKAMLDEIQKFRKFDAFKTVVDTGQYAIKTRWVVTEHEDTSKGYNLKTRLCMRGDREKDVDSIRADSPTAHKDALKLALAIAANERFDITAADIKSAFLQGRTLERDVYVIPPPEANQDGKLWLLNKAAYGLIDGSRLFYLQLKAKLEKVGMREVSGNSALFTMHSDGKLIGLVCSHVDDLFMAGNNRFKKIVAEKILNMFQFSKVEHNSFKYLGCEVQKEKNGDISLNQNDYIQKLEVINIPEGRNSFKVNETGRKAIRKVVGELLWVSLMTRPDLSYEVNRLSGNILNATLKDMKDAKLLIEKAKADPVKVNFTKIGEEKDLEIKVYTDASFNNQDDKIRSTAGRVLLLGSRSNDRVNAFSWKTKKIARICRSVKGAETRALESGLDEAVNFARMVKEIYSGDVNLKTPKQINVKAFTDNKGLWENLHNSRQCEEKLLRNSVALMKEMMDHSEVKEIKWVETDNMLADILTKKSGGGEWIKTVISRNII